MRTWFVIVIICLLGLSCSGEPESSSACDEAMRTAADEPDNEKANPLITRTLSECTTVDEWLTALEHHPAAMGLTERAEIGDLDVQVACSGHEQTPVCEDAVEQGVQLFP